MRRTRIAWLSRWAVPALLLLVSPLPGLRGDPPREEPADNTAPAVLTDAETAAAFEALAGEIEAAPLDLVWPHAFRLERLGPRATPLARERATRTPGDAWSLVLGWLLVRGGEPEEGAAGLEPLLSGASEPAARAAARILGGTPSAPAIQALERALAAGLPDARRVPVAAALWESARSPASLRALQELHGSGDTAASREAALALAQGGHLDAVRAEIETMQMEPTAQGERARAILIRENLAAAAAAEGDPEVLRQIQIMREVADLVERYYIDPVEAKQLGAWAALGIAQGLDPNSTYYTEEELASHIERYQGEYAGIGAHVSKDPAGYVQIVSPIYGGPAHQAGLQAGDRITEVEGEPTQRLTLDEAVDLIRGPTGTPVRFKIFREGLTEPMEITLNRGMVQVPSVYAESLPGGIGYLRLTQFGNRSAQELAEGMTALQGTGVRGWILDLRGNPGGLLTTAVQVCDLFLPPEQMVVYSEGRNPQVARRREFFSGGFMHRFRNGVDWVNPDLARRLGITPPPRLADATTPLVVLVDGGSASGSEVVAGCLQDLERGALVGVRTFGKGSVQDEFALQSTDRKTRFKLTIAKYYLPSQRCIHGEGIEPDVVQEIPRIEGWKFAEMRALGGRGIFDGYLGEHLAPDRATLERLAVRDDGDASRYPGFDAWYGTLETSLSRDDVRRALRYHLRERLAREQARPFPVDPALDDDPQLQRGILVLAGRMGLDPASVEAYRTFAERLSQEAPQANAAPPGGGNGE